MTPLVAITGNPKLRETSELIFGIEPLPKDDTEVKLKCKQVNTR